MNQPPATKPQPAPTREITEARFIAEFHPRRAKDGVRHRLYDCRQLDETLRKLDDLTRALALSQVWTVTENDDDRAIVSGKHMTNRLFYIVTDKPHNGADIVVPLT